MIYTDKYPDDMPADSEETKTENLFIEKHKQDTLTSNQIIIPLDTSLYNEDKIVEIEETENENHIVKGQKKSIGEIREELSGITDANEFLQLLNIYKLKGILVFGGKDAFNDPEKCDMAIFNPVTKEVLAYLLQSEKKFIDYKSNEPIKDYSITFNGMTAIWIKYFK